MKMLTALASILFSGIIGLHSIGWAAESVRVNVGYKSGIAASQFEITAAYFGAEKILQAGKINLVTFQVAAGAFDELRGALTVRIVPES